MNTKTKKIKFGIIKKWSLPLFIETEFTDEKLEWLRLTPEQRILETTKLWRFYVTLGGNLDPEPDPQSPFYAQETQG